MPQYPPEKIYAAAREHEKASGEALTRFIQRGL
jgi:hypothetical protein